MLNPVTRLKSGSAQGLILALCSDLVLLELSGWTMLEFKPGSSMESKHLTPVSKPILYHVCVVKEGA